MQPLPVTLSAIKALSALPGPDLRNKKDILIRISGLTTAMQVFAFFGYTGCPELFFCYACLLAPLVKHSLTTIRKRPASSSRSGLQGSIKGLHLRVNKEPFQIKSQFLKHNGALHNNLGGGGGSVYQACTKTLSSLHQDIVIPKHIQLLKRQVSTCQLLSLVEYLRVR
jgi:hypothetical protein